MNKIYIEIRNSILGIFDNYLLNAAIKRDQELLGAVLKSLGCLYYIETEYSDVITKKYFKKISNFIATFLRHEIDVPSFNNEKMDEDEIVATHNFLYVYIKNIYKLSKSSFCKELSKAEIERIFSGKNKDSFDFDSKTSSIDAEKTTILRPAGEQPYNRPSNIPTGSGYSENENEVLIKNAQGSIVLNTNFYPYDKKPKIVPILKTIFASISALISVFFFITLIFYIAAQTLLAPLDTAGMNVNFITAYLWPAFESLIFGYFAFVFFKQTKISRTKYTISILWGVFIIMNCIFSILIVAIPTGQEFFRQSADANPQEMSTITGFNVINILLLISIVASILVIGVTMLNNPKINREKLMKLVEGQNQRNNFPNPFNNFGPPPSAPPPSTRNENKEVEQKTSEKPKKSPKKTLDPKSDSKSKSPISKKSSVIKKENNKKSDKN